VVSLALPGCLNHLPVLNNVNPIPATIPNKADRLFFALLRAAMKTASEVSAVDDFSAHHAFHVGLVIDDPPPGQHIQTHISFILKNIR